MSVGATTFNCPVCGILIHGRNALEAISKLLEHTQAQTDGLHVDQNNWMRDEICGKRTDA